MRITERLLFATLWRTTNRDYADRSRLIWSYRGDGCYRLTPMGLLNTVLNRFGIVLALEVP